MYWRNRREKDFNEQNHHSELIDLNLLICVLCGEWLYDPIRGKRDMPTTEEKQVLTLLSKEWDHSGPPGIMDICDIVAALGQAPSETVAAIMGLYQRGLVDMNPLKISAFLTPEGREMGENFDP